MACSKVHGSRTGILIAGTQPMISFGDTPDEYHFRAQAASLLADNVSQSVLYYHHFSSPPPYFESPPLRFWHLLSVHELALLLHCDMRAFSCHIHCYALNALAVAEVSLLRGDCDVAIGKYQQPKMLM